MIDALTNYKLSIICLWTLMSVKLILLNLVESEADSQFLMIAH